jgi:hypothetical protein
MEAQGLSFSCMGSTGSLYTVGGRLPSGLLLSGGAGIPALAHERHNSSTGRCNTEHTAFV